LSEEFKREAIGLVQFSGQSAKLFGGLDELQSELDDWLEYYNNERTHQGKMCCGRTPLQTLEDGKQIWKKKFVA
jgi:hypothetical protein